MAVRRPDKKYLCQVNWALLGRYLILIKVTLN